MTKILTNHIELFEVTINKSISEFFEAEFIDIEFQTQIIFRPGIHLINFKYFSVFL